MRLRPQSRDAYRGRIVDTVYTIGYKMSSDDKAELQTVNEAACIDADVEGIVNNLRNLFNVNM